MVNHELINLVRLQRLDMRIERLRKVEIEAPERMAAMDAELLAVETKLQEAEDREQEMKKRRRELEAEVEDADEKIKTNQVRQLQVKTNDEYRALLKENEYLRKTSAAHEDEALQLMVALEQFEKDNVELRAWAEQEKKSIEARRQGLEKEIEQSRMDQQALLPEREELIREIQPAHLSTYQRVYIGRNGKAVVPISAGICQECHLAIPPQLFNELQKNQSFITCPNCMRIIYWMDHEDFQDL